MARPIVVHIWQSGSAVTHTRKTTRAAACGRRLAGLGTYDWDTGCTMHVYNVSPGIIFRNHGLLVSSFLHKQLDDLSRIQKQPELGLIKLLYHSFWFVFMVISFIIGRTPKLSKEGTNLLYCASTADYCFFQTWYLPLNIDRWRSSSGRFNNPL